jgi:hypothetical protein
MAYAEDVELEDTDGAEIIPLRHQRLVTVNSLSRKNGSIPGLFEIRHRAERLSPKASWRTGRIRTLCIRWVQNWLG